MKKKCFNFHARGSFKELILAMRFSSFLCFFIPFSANANIKDLQISKLTTNVYETNILPQESNENLSFLKFDNNDSTQLKKVSGVVTEGDEPMIGVSVSVKGTILGALTDIDGKYTIENIPDDAVLVFSFIGYKELEIPVNGRNVVNASMSLLSVELEEVVVVGYSVQKKESVVGAISQIESAEIMKSGGVSNVGEALQGKLPGVTTIYTSGQPGSDEMQIFIRGLSSWNSSTPLILVDGIERSMTDIDMNEIESLSVLKDASATAVYGVKGANGVILLTTKRGSEGKMQLSVSANTTFKFLSKLPTKLESYDAIKVANESIMRELMYRESSWESYIPEEIALRYKNQTTQLEKEMYPNVDWTEYLFKDFAIDNRINLSSSGGTKRTKYFINLAFLNEGDIFKKRDIKDYDAETTYERLNYRSNIDFNITRTTKFSLNLSGMYGLQKTPNGNVRRYTAIYRFAPDYIYPIYSDGYIGYGYLKEVTYDNPIQVYYSSGVNNKTTLRTNTDFKIEQDLKFITEGLKFNAALSIDNTISGSQVIIDDISNNYLKYYDTEGNVIYATPVNNDYEYVIEPWTIDEFSINSGSRIKRQNYQMSLNYNRSFAKAHNVGALFLFKREQYTSGSMFPIYYEDWVGRVTYDYKNRYLFEFNGAYNGSEKFGPGYRFNFFPSVALGYTLTNEPFMKSVKWLNKFKIRGSYGIVGDDSFSGRWLYINQWGSTSNGACINVPGMFNMNNPTAQSPYSMYYESVLGNKDLHWEFAEKKDLGIELALFKNLLTFEFDYFSEYRSDIFIASSSRNVAPWLGIAAPAANLGEVKSHGLEIVAGIRHNINNDFRIWVNGTYTKAKDMIIYKEDPELTPDYLKEAGYSIGQLKLAIPTEIMQNWDDVYMSTPLTSGDESKRIGYYDVVDFDGDGIYNGTYDKAPQGYPNRPQNTWTIDFGGEYKGFSLSVQFYGHYNTLMDLPLLNLYDGTHIFFEESLGYWSKDNSDATLTLNSYSLPNAATDPLMRSHDASMVRLKMIEFAYKIPKATCKKLGLTGLRVFVNGSNLALWSDLPDDRDYTAGIAELNNGDYPNFRRINVGFKLDF